MARRTSVHGSKHARDEPIDAVAFLNLGDERTDTTLIVGRTAEVGEDQLLKRVDLVLQVHEVADGLVSADSSMSISVWLDPETLLDTSIPLAASL